ncbi:MAG: nucleotidyltransferase family protein [Bacteriovorax sp.]|jgi:hypothetical protein
MNFQIPIVENLAKQKNCMDLLNEHHVTGIIYHYFPEFSVHNDCMLQYKKQWIHNHVLLNVIEEISTHAAIFKTSATLLKGADLLLDIYTDVGSRFLSDIDLLIPAEDSAKWENLLSKLGFEPTRLQSFYGNRFKKEWIKKIGEVEVNIELHTSLFFHLKKENWQTTGTPYLNLTRLKNEDMLIHLCGHVACQHSFLCLYWIFDIYFFYQKHFHELDWNLLKSKSIEHNLFTSVQMCLWILSQHFGVRLESEIERLFEINKKKWWMNLLTISFLLNPMEKKYKYYLVKQATKDQITSALRYDLSWFFHYKIQRLWSKQ